MTKKMTATKKAAKKNQVIRHRELPRGVDLTIVYAGGLDHDRDRAIHAALESYNTGSGFSFSNGERDITATVPASKLLRIIAALKNIPNIEIKCVGDRRRMAKIP